MEKIEDLFGTRRAMKRRLDYLILAGHGNIFEQYLEIREQPLLEHATRLYFVEAAEKYTSLASVYKLSYNTYLGFSLWSPRASFYLLVAA